MENFMLYRKKRDQIIESDSFAEIFPNWKGRAEHWLFISPHDDDIVLGSGLLLQKAIQENIRISIIITTDGQMGYCKSSQRDDIVEIRKQETLESFARLNINNVHWLNFPDCNLNAYIGRRKAKADESCIIEGFTGLQNAYTYYLRQTIPTRIFLPTGADLHIDHKIVSQELLVSLFHASNNIWPELGISLAYIPEVYEMAIYCSFPENPDIKIISNMDILERKLHAIRAYDSQENIIDKLVNNLKNGGPVEYFRDINFNLYSPKNYQHLF